MAPSTSTPAYYPSTAGQHQCSGRCRWAQPLNEGNANIASPLFKAQCQTSLIFQYSCCRAIANERSDTLHFCQPGEISPLAQAHTGRGLVSRALSTVLILLLLCCMQDGVTTTGVSVAFTVLACDAGPIFLQESSPVHEGEQAPQLLDRLFKQGAQLLVNNIDRVWTGEAARVAWQQDHAQATHAAKVKGLCSSCHQGTYVAHATCIAGTSSTLRVAMCHQLCRVS